MSAKRLVNYFSAVIMLVGIAVMIGWIFDIGVLKSILPNWVAMKFTTAICFVFSGVTIQAIARYRETKSSIAQIILMVSTLILLLIMGSFLISAFTGARLGVEELFLKETEGAVKTVLPGRPSIPTMINFVLIALAGVIALLNSPESKLRLMQLGWIIAFIGAIAVIGYAINLPLLYYYVEGWNTAIAAHTALLFVIIGICLILIGSNKHAS